MGKHTQNDWRHKSLFKVNIHFGVKSFPGKGGGEELHIHLILKWVELKNSETQLLRLWEGKGEHFGVEAIKSLN